MAEEDYRDRNAIISGLSLMVSMYLIVWRYPTLIAVRDDLRRY